MKSSLLLFLAIFLFVSQSSANTDYYTDRILLKVKDNYRNLCSADGIDHVIIQQVEGLLLESSLKKMFPNHRKPRVKSNNGLPLADISLIYRWQFKADLSPHQLVSILQKSNIFEYVEVEYIMQPLANQFIPNDPNVTDQWHLELMQLFEAWDIEQGDTNVVIGITDTGVELDHPDLQDNIKYNYNDPINGIDDDGDGKIDNFYGWDLGDNDNDPTFEGSNHGIPVSGLAAATTNNNNQIAGTGFKCKFLPIKIMDSDGTLAKAYEGIIFAADQGCAVINCSWGSPNSFNQTAQEIINYATINKNALVVCAAGNNKNSDKFYPASYQWALSVGGTNANDEIWIGNIDGTNYNELVDVTAPSTGVFAIINNGNTIGGRNGTSIAAPIVAGIAALVKSINPNLSAIQIGEQIKSSADFIDTIPANVSYAGLLGHGRVNAFRAVNDFSKPGLQFLDPVAQDFNDEWFTAEDTLSIWGKVTNFLSATSNNAVAKITTTSPYVEIIQNDIPIGGINPNTQLNLQNNPFKVRLIGDIPSNHKAQFVVEMIDGTYKGTGFFELDLKTDYLNYEYNNLATTITSNGKIGFNVTGSQGQGVKYKGNPNILYRAGFKVGNAEDKISFALDDDFITTASVELQNPGTISLADAQTKFSDANASNPLLLEVKQETKAWNDQGLDQTILLSYTLLNTGNDTLKNIHAGIHADWDIIDFQQNFANYDSSHQLAYAYHNQGLYAGFHLVNDTNIHHYAFENSGSNGSFNIGSAFTKSQQFKSISEGNSRESVNTPTDVSHSIGAGPYEIAPNDSVEVVFAMVAGESLAELQTQSIAIDSLYNAIHKVELLADLKAACYNECDGKVTLSTNFGVAPYVFDWFSFDNSDHQQKSNLCANTYSVAVLDANGNKDTLTFVVDENTIINNIFDNVVKSDENECNGEALANPSGGTPPYAFIWEYGNSESAFNNELCSGVVNLTITDSLNCELKDSVEIDIITQTNLPNSNTLKIFPNPTSDFVRIQINQIEGFEQMLILDLNGKVLYQSNNIYSDMQVPIGSFAKGTYLLQMVGKQQFFYKKIIKK